MDESSVERDDADSSDAQDDDEIQPIDGPYDEDAMLREIEPLLRRTGDLAPTFEEVWRRLARRGWWRRDGVGLLDEIFFKPGATTRAPHVRDRDYFCSKFDLLRALRARCAAEPASTSSAPRPPLARFDLGVVDHELAGATEAEHVDAEVIVAETDDAAAAAGANAAVAAGASTTAAAIQP